MQSDQQKVIEEHQRWCELIEERRQNAKLTRQKLAEMAGIDVSTLRNIEKGRIQTLSPFTINRLRSVTQLNLPLSLDEDAAPSLSPSRRKGQRI